MVVLKLDRRSGLRIVRSVLLVLRRVCGRHGWIVHGWVVSRSVVTSLSLLLRSVIANCRVDEEANKGKTGASQYYINVESAVYAHKTKMLNPMPAALVPLMTATRSMINTPPKKPVWKQFMVRNVPGFSALRMKSTMARTSMSRQMIMNSMKTTTLLYQVSKCCKQEIMITYATAGSANSPIPSTARRAYA